MAIIREGTNGNNKGGHIWEAKERRIRDNKEEAKQTEREEDEKCFKFIDSTFLCLHCLFNLTVME